MGLSRARHKTGRTGNGEPAEGSNSGDDLAAGKYDHVTYLHVIAG